MILKKGALLTLDPTSILKKKYFKDFFQILYMTLELLNVISQNYLMNLITVSQKHYMDEGLHLNLETNFSKMEVVVLGCKRGRKGQLQKTQKLFDGSLQIRYLSKYLEVNKY